MNDMAGCHVAGDGCICAAGDAYRYTLTPVFSNLRTSFRCYVRRKVPTGALYRLSMYLTLPGNEELESPRLEQHVLETSGHERDLFLSDLVHRGRHTLFGLLTVDHDAGSRPMDSELLLTARRSQQTTNDDDTTTLLNYTIQPASAGPPTEINVSDLNVLFSKGVAVVIS